MTKKKKSTFLDREGILGASDLKTEEVYIPEWGGSVRVRSLTGVERDQFEEESLLRKSSGKFETNMKNIRARLVSLTVIDEQGERLFSNDDVVKLGKKNAAALNRVFTVSQKLSGVGSDDIKELAGN